MLHQTTILSFGWAVDDNSVQKIARQLGIRKDEVRVVNLFSRIDYDRVLCEQVGELADKIRALDLRGQRVILLAHPIPWLSLLVGALFAQQTGKLPEVLVPGKTQNGLIYVSEILDTECLSPR